MREEEEGGLRKGGAKDSASPFYHQKCQNPPPKKYKNCGNCLTPATKSY